MKGRLKVSFYSYDIYFLKNQIFLTILGVLLTTGCYAQNKYSEGISKAKGEQFQITYTGLDNDLIVISNVKNKYAKGGPVSDNPNALPFRREDIHIDVPAANAIIQQVLKPKNEKLHQNEDFVNVLFRFERSGKLSDISFGLKPNTLISLEDIAEIDARLRGIISATYTGKAYKDHKTFMYSLGMIRF